MVANARGTWIMVRVMVTGVGSNVAQGIIVGVREHDARNWILGTDVSGMCAGYFLCDKGAQVPYATNPAFARAVTGLIKANLVEYVLIGVDAELPVYAEHKQEIESFAGCKILVSDAGLISKCADKYLTSLFLKELGLDYPVTILKPDVEDIEGELGYPFVAKPRRGNGSKGVFVVHSRQELWKLLSAVDTRDYCFQEYIDGEEYTCGLLFDKENRLSDSIVMRRELENGTTIKASVVDVPEIQKLMEKFGQRVGALGSINLQLRLSRRGPVVFEINPRFSGTTDFRIKAGYNDVGRLLDNLIYDKPIEKAKVKKLHFFRRWETMVIEKEVFNNADIERIC